jgi:protein PhnA
MVNISSTKLVERCEGKCEICTSDNNVREFIVAPKTGDSIEDMVVLCDTCHSQIEKPETMEANHWRCLNESMWSTVPAVQVLSYRMLDILGTSNPWASDLLNTMYLDDQTMEWAQFDASSDKHMDSNGKLLEKGDSIVLIQDLDVKGANMVAKRGTVVKNIILVADNPGQIEGKVNDQQIVILTKFVRKA